MTVSPTLNLTPARRRALDVLAATHPRPGRYSNVSGLTRPSEPRIALVHWQAADWQAADWLIAAGLVSLGISFSDGIVLHLTDAGLAACDDAGITS